MIIETTETAARSPEALPKIHRKAYMIRCPGCGKTFFTFLAQSTKNAICRDCGAHISLDGLRKIYAVCACGGYSACRTNIVAPEVVVDCPACRKPMTAKWDARRLRYECGVSCSVRKHDTKEDEGQTAADKELIRLPLMVLHDKFGFGRERAGRFIAHMTTLAEEYHSGEVTLQDITDALEADGIKIEEDR